MKLFPSRVDESIIMKNIKSLPPISINKLYHDKKVEKIIFRQDLTEAVTLENNHVYRTELHPSPNGNIKDDVATSLIPIKTPILGRILPYALPLGVLYVLFNGLFGRIVSTNNMMKENPRVNISDWAGSPEIFDEVYISPTYNGAGGYTMYMPLVKEDLYTKDYLFQKICIQLGGRAAEDVFYGRGDQHRCCIRPATSE